METKLEEIGEEQISGTLILANEGINAALWVHRMDWISS